MIILKKKSPKVWEICFKDVIIYRTFRIMDDKKAIEFTKNYLRKQPFFKNKQINISLEEL